MADQQYFIDTYDEYVDDQDDDGAVVEKSRDAVAHRYADDVDNGLIPRLEVGLVEEGRHAFDRYVGPARERRRDRLRKDASDLLDALEGDTILGMDDPVLVQAYPLGNGRDKTLRLWTADDWAEARTERYRNAAAVTASAAEFDALAQRAINALAAHTVQHMGDMIRLGDDE